uniref:Uncharacterized protein n=1 Tax=Rhizophora mucronata TaxID=61149 RepID=A0A2P2MBS3_RHIMU
MRRRGRKHEETNTHFQTLVLCSFNFSFFWALSLVAFWRSQRE